MTLDDLEALPESPLVVAEGTVLPAWAVSSGVIPRSRAVWLLPTLEHRRARLVATGATGGEATFRLALSEVIEHEASEHGVPTIAVDDSRSAVGVAEEVELLFAEAVAAGPRAATPSERRALLREMNMAVVEQVRGYYARPWADADPGPITRPFVCECGEPACAEQLYLTVSDVAAAPALSPTH